MVVEEVPLEDLVDFNDLAPQEPLLSHQSTLKMCSWALWKPSSLQWILACIFQKPLLAQAQVPSECGPSFSVQWISPSPLWQFLRPG